MNKGMKFPKGNESKDSKSRNHRSNQGRTPSTHRCEDSPQLILRALDGIPNPQVIQSVRDTFGTCTQCSNALDIEIRFKLAMAQQITIKAPPSLQVKISESLKRNDLGDITVTDL